MKKTKLVVAGGFLGAGKTTLLWKSARKLAERGIRAALVTNDQAAELVDSRLLSLNSFPVAEVSGSCFCCNFNGFADAVKKLRSETVADVIIAEPVGSCVDLSATVIQPLKHYCGTEFQTAPLSAVADPTRLQSIIAGKNAGLHPDAAYICRKQFEESDIILINKSDLLDGESLDVLKHQTSRAFPDAAVMTASAANGTGIDEWLDTVLSESDSGKHIAEVDYDIYASGEAALGWLNGVVELHGKDADWDMIFSSLMKSIAQRLDENGMTAGHVKAIAENGRQYAVGNITGRAETLSIRGSAGTGDSIRLTVNARVETSPENLDRTVRSVIDSLCGKQYSADIVAWKCLQPGRPQPTYRFTEKSRETV